MARSLWWIHLHLLLDETIQVHQTGFQLLNTVFCFKWNCSCKLFSNSKLLAKTRCWCKGLQTGSLFCLPSAFLQCESFPSFPSASFCSQSNRDLLGCKKSCQPLSPSTPPHLAPRRRISFGNLPVLDPLGSCFSSHRALKGDAIPVSKVKQVSSFLSWNKHNCMLMT